MYIFIFIGVKEISRYILMVIKLCWQLFVLGLKEFSSLQWK